MGPRVDVHLDCPGFEDYETFSAIADALLAKNKRAWRSELDPLR